LRFELNAVKIQPLVGDLKLKVPVNVGIEFEFAGKNRKFIYDTLKQTGVKIGIQSDYWMGDYPLTKQWKLCFDGSVTEVLGPMDKIAGLEIKTPIFDPRDTVVRNDMRKILKRLKSIGCFVTKSSGLHVHISCPLEEFRVRRNVLSMLIEKHFRKFVNDCRKHYCKPGCSQEKYSSIRVFPIDRCRGDITRNHVEIRVFNGTMDTDTALSYLDRAVKYYRIALEYRKVSREVRNMQDGLCKRGRGVCSCVSSC